MHAVGEEERQIITALGEKNKRPVERIFCPRSSWQEMEKESESPVFVFVQQVSAGVGRGLFFSGPL